MTTAASPPPGIPVALAPQGGHASNTPLPLRAVPDLPGPMMEAAPPLHADPIPDRIPAHASAVVVVDLEAVRTNYRALRTIAGRAECAGVVKADAYGLGLEPVVRALLKEGCRVFFVASIDEAWRTRQIAPDAIVYVLNGLYPGAGSAFIELKVQPVLGSIPEVQEWASICTAGGHRMPAAIHVDTGMNRLGLSLRELPDLLRRQAFDNFDISLIMSHLASADSPGSGMNAGQRQQFDTARAMFPSVRASLANSAAMMLGPAFHYDLVRPGIAVYGGRALVGVQNPMKHAVRLLARIVQIRDVAPGESVGYGQTFRAARQSRIAIVAAGYADGLPRGVTNGSLTIVRGMPPSMAESVRSGVGSPVHIHGYPLPIVGRVSMDLIAVDATDMPAGRIARGDFAELIGRNASVDTIAAHAETIGYEVLTRLSRRAHRLYLGGSSQ